MNSLLHEGHGEVAELRHENYIGGAYPGGLFVNLLDGGSGAVQLIEVHSTEFTHEMLKKKSSLISLFTSPGWQIVKMCSNASSRSNTRVAPRGCTRAIVCTEAAKHRTKHWAKQSREAEMLMWSATYHENYEC